MLSRQTVLVLSDGVRHCTGSDTNHLSARIPRQQGLVPLHATPSGQSPRP